MDNPNIIERKQALSRLPAIVSAMKFYAIAKIMHKSWSGLDLYGDYEVGLGQGEEEEDEIFRQMLIVVDTITPEKTALIVDFLPVWVLYNTGNAHEKEQSEEDIIRLIPGMINIFSRVFKTTGFRRFQFNKESTGTTCSQIKNIVTPSSFDETNLHIKKTNVLPISPEDIGVVQADWADYQRNKYQGNTSPQPEVKSETKYSEHWYALLHVILVYLGIEDQFIDKEDKPAIIAFGKNRYKLKTSGQGFYNRLLDNNLDLLDMATTVKNLPQKDRSKWKAIITELSNNNAAVILWLKKQPN